MMAIFYQEENNTCRRLQFIVNKIITKLFLLSRFGKITNNVTCMRLYFFFFLENICEAGGSACYILTREHISVLIKEN
jgi:hypothetical protein